MAIKQLRSWTEPKISPKNTSAKDAGFHCFVWFRFFDKEKQRMSNPIRRKPAIPQGSTRKDIYLELKALVDVINFKLHIQRWNPITKTYDPHEEIEFDEDLKKLRELNFCDALDFAFIKKRPDWRKKSAQDYSSVIRYLKQAAAMVELHDKKICEFRLPHYRAILDTVKELRKLSAAGYNKYRDYLSGLVKELIQFEIVEINLVHHVKTKQTIKRFAHRPPTKDEQGIIMRKIIKDHYPYYRFLSILYGCTLRPKEITRLKIKHLHKKEHKFIIPYDEKEENLKTKADREVIIPVWVMDLLMGMNLQNYDPEFYIFSTFNKYRSFLPGKKAMHSNSTNRLWKKIVKQGLGLDVNQYSLKKLAGNDMVRLQTVYGASNLLMMPQHQMGHADQSMTEVYVQEHKEVMNEIIKTKMPVL